MIKKGKDVIDIKRNDIPIKRIITRDIATGKIISLMEKPKIKEIDPSIHVSGCHLVPDNPEESHYDHYHEGKKWEERPTKDKKLDYPIKIKNNSVESTE